ncbi:hypothetical protein EDD22DRAFT_952323 [Suillus occidentalis]|nr:hypothetical protein EDD22DRAFT_952323 [Suillus occidentalis]
MVRSVVTSSREEVEAADRTRRVAHETAENAQRSQEELEQAMHEALQKLFTEQRKRGPQPSADGLKVYSPNFIHLADVGSAGSGKSSFINAVRGMSNNDPATALTGIVEVVTSLEVEWILMQINAFNFKLYSKAYKGPRSAGRVVPVPSERSGTETFHMSW